MYFVDERHGRVEFVFKKVGEHVNAEIEQCLHYAFTIKGLFSSDVDRPL